MSRGTDECFASEVWILFCRFIRTHFTVQLNLPVYRRENSPCTWPNTITPFDSPQNRGAGLPELLTSLRQSNEVAQKQNQTSVTVFLAAREKESPLLCPERYLSETLLGKLHQC